MQRSGRDKTALVGFHLLLASHHHLLRPSPPLHPAVTAPFPLVAAHLLQMDDVEPVSGAAVFESVKRYGRVGAPSSRSGTWT